jgi:hypothetical protein
LVNSVFHDYFLIITFLAIVIKITDIKYGKRGQKKIIPEDDLEG